MIAALVDSDYDSCCEWKGLVLTMKKRTTAEAISFGREGLFVLDAIKPEGEKPSPRRSDFERLFEQEKRVITFV